MDDADRAQAQAEWMEQFRIQHKRKHDEQYRDIHKSLREIDLSMTRLIATRDGR